MLPASPAAHTDKCRLQWQAWTHCKGILPESALGRVCSSDDLEIPQEQTAGGTGRQGLGQLPRLRKGRQRVLTGTTRKVKLGKHDTAPALPQASGLHLWLTAYCVARKLPEAPYLQLDGGWVLPSQQPGRAHCSALLLWKQFMRSLQAWLGLPAG